MAYVTHTITISPSGNKIEITNENKEVMEDYIKKYPYGFFIGDEGREWIEENMEEYIFIDGRMNSNKGNYDHAVCFFTKADAARFKLTFK
jgi:hypothetical protein